MKKLLIGTSALVAAGLVAGAAHAADPIKLSLGGFAGTWVTYADNEDSYLTNAAVGEVTAVDVKGDAEVFYLGSTTLDNGLKVSFKAEMEAGGRDKTTVNTPTGTANVTGDAIDEYAISVAGAFGTVVMGADDNALAAIAVTSPRVGGRIHGGAFSEGDAVVGNVILAPAGIVAPNATFVNTGGDSESVSYISPSFGGFTVGATYVPSFSQGDDTPAVPTGNNATDAYGIGAAYAGEFSGVGVKVAGGWLTADTANAGATVNVDDWNEYQIGANLSYAGFTFGGGFRHIDVELNTVGAAATPGSFDQRAWDLGLSYKTGPYGVSLAYFDSKAENGNGTTDDTRKVWELNGEYSMGPGVSLVGSINHAKFENGLTAAQRAVAGTVSANENSGWAVSSGISLSF
ncbi:MAG: porin [Rhodospirillaceae bacterium]